ncbi:hypothetical protein [Sphaerimonospora mesophila]|uniref:hypothetical protein n=1 Tax=Sphaerimonospora mesophila TaxID=37483 RepID=UPI000AEB4AAD
MKYLVILTMQKPLSEGLGVVTFSDTVTVRPGTSRFELLNWAIGKLDNRFRTNGNILCFYAEPDELGR